MGTTKQPHVPTIVYVEDNAGDAVLLREALAECGHPTTLTVIEEGVRALHYFEVKASAHDVPPPHCILLDSYLLAITGVELLRFLRKISLFDDTPVYIFASKREYLALLKDAIVSDESFLTKPTTWRDFLDLAELLMKSASAKQDRLPASADDVKPEVHAEGALRADFVSESKNEPHH